MLSPQSILITGASSGIGAALAITYAAPGITLALTGRDPIRLAGTANRCRDLGATVRTAVIDAVDRVAMQAFILARDTEQPLDLVVANAGVSYGTGNLTTLDDRVRRMFDVNVGGVLNTVHPALDRMVARGRGQIALMASLAGFRGAPSAPGYAATKAAVRSYGEGLRGQFAGRGIEVSVVCPGFVRSAMTKGNRFPMPFLMDADRAAAIVVRGLARNQGRIAFPWPMYFGAWLLNAMPDALAGWLTSRMPEKR